MGDHEFREMSKKGVEILVVPSVFTAETGAAHWELLVRASAVENLCYVIAPNQDGLHLNGHKRFGHSMIIDPWASCWIVIKRVGVMFWLK